MGDTATRETTYQPVDPPLMSWITPPSGRIPITTSQREVTFLRFGGGTLSPCRCVYVSFSPEHGGEVFAVRMRPHHDAGVALHEKSGRYGEQGKAGGGAALLGTPAQVHRGPRPKPEIPCKRSLPPQKNCEEAATVLSVTGQLSMVTRLKLILDSD